MALTDNLIAYWALNEASGNALDALGSLDLTDENGVGTNGAGARAFVAANAESFFHLSTAAFQTGNIDFTLAVKVALTDIDTTQMLLSKYDDGTTNTEYALFFEAMGEGAGRFALAVQGPTAGFTVLYADTFGTITPGVTYCVVGWHDAAANTLHIAVEGVQDTLPYSDGTLAEAGLFRLGAAGQAGGLFLNGLLYYAGLWKRVLTAPEQATVCTLEYPFTAPVVGLVYGGPLPSGMGTTPFVPPPPPPPPVEAEATGGWLTPQQIANLRGAPAIPCGEPGGPPCPDDDEDAHAPATAEAVAAVDTTTARPGETLDAEARAQALTPVVAAHTLALAQADLLRRAALAQAEDEEDALALLLVLLEEL